VGEQTRSSRARVVIDNKDGVWRPGMFVNVHLTENEAFVPMAVKAEALQTFRDWDVVFIKVGDKFEARPLELGRREGEWVEVLAGLTAGMEYASKNSFVVKADVLKSGASHDH
jgi:cobalt-zinc-cadmium efflux system membrane fusion protein